jgi:DUF1680 family protein
MNQKTLLKFTFLVGIFLFSQANILLFAQKNPTSPFEKIQTKAETFRALPFHSVKPNGWLKEELQKNMQGFCGNLDKLAPDLLLKDDIYGKNRLSKKTKSKDVGAVAEAGDWQVQFLWWNSETQSNWLEGFVRTAILLEDTAQLAKAEKIIQYLLSTQDKDGYIGIYDTELRYHFENENGELWAKTTLFRALLAWYEYKKDKKILHSVEKAVQNVMKNYPIYRSHPFYSKNPNAGGLTHGLVFTDVLEELYLLTNKKSYLDYCLFLYQDFSTQTLAEDAQYAKLKHFETHLEGHGVHTYEHLRPLAAAYYASGNPNLGQALADFVAKIQRTTAPSGAGIGDEFIRAKQADAKETAYEFCSLHELMASWISLFGKMGEIQYGDKAERIFFNAALGATHPNESAICYLKTDNSFTLTGGKNGDTTDKYQTRYRYSPVHKEAAVCCVPNAGRIVPYFVKSMWLQDKEGLVAGLLGPCEVSTEIAGNAINIKENTDYPFENRFYFEVSTQKSLIFTLKIRKPQWATGVQCSLPYKEENGFLVIRQEWKQKNEFTLSFEANVQVKETFQQEKYFEYGALVLCREIAGEQHITKKFEVAGLRESTYTPVNLFSYQYANATVNKLADKKNIFATQMFNNQANKMESVNLVPMAKTILRQVSFPIKK